MSNGTASQYMEVGCNPFIGLLKRVEIGNDDCLPQRIRGRQSNRVSHSNEASIFVATRLVYEKAVHCSVVIGFSRSQNR